MARWALAFGYMTLGILVLIGLIAIATAVNHTA